MLQTQSLGLTFTGGVDTKTEGKSTLYTSFREMTNSRTDALSAVLPRGGITESALVSVTETTITGPGFGVVSSPSYDIQYNSGTCWRTTGEGDFIAGSEIRGDAVRRPLGVSSAARMAVAYNTVFGSFCSAWADNTSGVYTISTRYQDANGDIVVDQSTYISSPISDISIVSCKGEFYVIYLTTAAGGTFGALRVRKTETGGLQNVTWSGVPAPGATVWDVDASSNFIYLYYAVGATANPTIQKIDPLGASFSGTISTPVSGLTGNVTCVAIRCLTAFTASSEIATTCASDTPAAHRLQFFTSALVQAGATVTIGNVVAAPRQTWIAQKSTVAVSLGTSGLDVGSVSAIQHRRTDYNYTTAIKTNSDTVLAFQLVAQPVYLDGRLIYIVDSTTTTTYGSQMLVESLENSPMWDPAYTFGVSKNLGNQEVVPVRALPKVASGGVKTYFPVCFVAQALSLGAPKPASNTIVRGSLSVQNNASLLILDPTKYAGKVMDTSNQQSLALGSVTRQTSTYRNVAYPWPELAIEPASLRLFVDTAPPVPFTGTVSCVLAKVLTFGDGSVYRSYTPIFTALLSAAAIRYQVSNPDLTTAGSGIAASVSIEFYKTEPNGTIFYLSGTQRSAGTFTDATSDLDLVKNRFADINGNELYPEITPGIRAGVRWKDRIVVVGADGPTKLKFNKPSAYPQGTTFADGLELDVGADGGDITALGTMDQALYVFKSNQIYSLYGDPAGATGEGGSLNVPTLLRNGLGTKDPRSVILTPRGLMFNSQKGFYILERNQEWVFVGDGPYADRSIALTGSAIDENQAEVYFSYENGTVWVYNYESKQWYKWTLTNTAKGIAVKENGLIGSSDYGHWEYSVTQQSDVKQGVATLIPQTYTTGWIRFGQIRGFQRIKRMYMLAERLSTDCTITIDVMVDYSDVVVQSFVFPLSASPGSFTSNPMQFDLHLAVQKCESMAFKIRTDRYGVKLIGATLTVGIKQGPDKSRTSSSNY